jgi:hypothetical protein
MVVDRPEASARAAASGKYPSASAADRTRISVGADTSSGWLIALETVAGDTPALRATSDNLTLRLDSIALGAMKEFSYVVSLLV